MNQDAEEKEAMCLKRGNKTRIQRKKFTHNYEYFELIFSVAGSFRLTFHSSTDFGIILLFYTV
jgi:uncharacterized protein YggL (DUF469 family)